VFVVAQMAHNGQLTAHHWDAYTWVAAAAAAAGRPSEGSGRVHTRRNAIKNDLSAHLLVTASGRVSFHPSEPWAADVQGSTYS